MNATQLLHNLGQSLWLDNITRDLLDSGTLKRYIDDLSITGLTSNPTIFDHAIKNSGAYDLAIRQKSGKGKSGEDLLFELALEDIAGAAEWTRRFRPNTVGRSSGADRSRRCGTTVSASSICVRRMRWAREYPRRIRPAA
jgi:transaldolase